VAIAALILASKTSMFLLKPSLTCTQLDELVRRVCKTSIIDWWTGLLTYSAQALLASVVTISL
jgi:hypothetical protein